MLLEAPIDESILGELPVRRPRQIEQLVPAQVDGVPVTYLVPLPAAPEDPSVVAVSSAPQAPQEPAPAPFSAPADATNLAAGQKVLQIYTVHSPTETPVTTTTPTPAPVAILVPQAAVSNILVPASNVHVDIVPADDAANMTGSVQPALLLEPAVVSVDVPPPGPGPEATPQQAAQVITLDLPAQASPVMVAQTVPAAPQDVPQVMVAQNEPPAAPQASQDPLAQQAPQDVPQVMAAQPVPAALQTSSPRPFAPAEPAWEQAPAAAAPQEQMAPIYVEPSVQLLPMGFSLPTVDPPGMLLSPPSMSFQGAVPQSGGPRLSAQVQADAAAQSAAWGAAEDAAQRNAEAVEQAAAQGAAQGPRAPQGPLPPRQYFDMSAPWTSRPMGPVGPPTILEKTIQMYPDGSYMYSYETADGVRVAEAGVLKKVPAAAAGEVPDPGAVGGAEAHTPGTRVANSVSGGYSYTAPDGTYFSLRYVADENGFRPIIGEMMDPMASAAPVQAKK
ncbi:Endocuticle structural glycoprotein SgAbd-2 [Frankliniella fusca]|uniref:Endocuticle structural glycoprotein SgAbd-2 n=1 Tax=Frankliniella fusca TaxID=407009 RepID=A0AAE1I0S8_9NEOP|nr:Endocuticle structural glycoprotein SgAbd-2 [Frankliniella fusca]